MGKHKKVREDNITGAQEQANTQHQQEEKHTAQQYATHYNTKPHRSERLEKH